MFARFPLLLLSALLRCALAVNLYVASYDGTIATLSLTRSPDCVYTLSQIATVNTTTPSPSWLTLDRQNNVLFMVDEAVTATNGTLVSYKTSHAGHLTEIQRIEALAGGVDATFFGSGSALAVPD